VGCREQLPDSKSKSVSSPTEKNTVESSLNDRMTY